MNGMQSGKATLSVDPAPVPLGRRHVDRGNLLRRLWREGDSAGLRDVAVIVTSGTCLTVEERGFDPYGGPRTEDWKEVEEIGSEVTERGFTFQEHVDSKRLIHFNGRAYDYNLGRFLSVDPIISDVSDSRSLNPYAYIMNNPLAGVDPTGYFVVWYKSKWDPRTGDFTIDFALDLESLGVAVTAKYTPGQIESSGSPVDILLPGSKEVKHLVPVRKRSGELEVTFTRWTAVEGKHVGETLERSREATGTWLGNFFTGLVLGTMEMLKGVIEGFYWGVWDMGPLPSNPALAANRIMGWYIGGAISGGLAGKAVSRTIGSGRIREMVGGARGISGQLARRFGTSPERVRLLERVITSEGGINTSRTVARQLARGGARQHIPTQSILDAIGSGMRIADPQGVAGQFLFRSPATINRSQGVLDVLVHEPTGQIRHVLFKRGVP